MNDTLDSIHFNRLSEFDPDEVCKRALCGYDAGDRCYILTVWNRTFRIYPEDARIIHEADGEPLGNLYVGLFALHYLMTAKEIAVKNEWISVKDIPGGVTFFRGPHAVPVDLIQDRFQGRLDAFSKVSGHFEGVPLEMADAAFQFRFAPRIPFAVLFWDADEEFPAESKILFDKTIIDHLALDIVFALTVEVCYRLAKQ